jgi:hypothetical protein
MGNPKIYATGNETLRGDYNISYYIFEKDPLFLDWLGKLLAQVLDIDDGEQKAKFIVERKDNDKGEWIEDKVYAKDINKMVDLHEKYENKCERVDVFYGHERVYVTLRKSKEIRKKFSDFVRKTKDWIEAKEVKNMPMYVQEFSN